MSHLQCYICKFDATKFYFKYNCRFHLSDTGERIISDRIKFMLVDLNTSHSKATFFCYFVFGEMQIVCLLTEPWHFNPVLHENCSGVPHGAQGSVFTEALFIIVGP